MVQATHSLSSGSHRSRARHKPCVSRPEEPHASPRVSRPSLAFFRTRHHPLRPPIAREEDAACKQPNVREEHRGEPCAARRQCSLTVGDRPCAARRLYRVTHSRTLAGVCPLESVPTPHESRPPMVRPVRSMCGGVSQPSASQRDGERSHVTRLIGPT